MPETKPCIRCGRQAVLRSLTRPHYLGVVRRDAWVCDGCGREEPLPWFWGTTAPGVKIRYEQRDLCWEKANA